MKYLGNRSLLYLALYLVLIGSLSATDYNLLFSNGQVNSSPISVQYPDRLSLVVEAGTATQAGSLDGNGNFRKEGAGALILLSDCSFSGPFGVNVGKLEIRSTNALKAASVGVAPGAVLSFGNLQSVSLRDLRVGPIGSVFNLINGNGGPLNLKVSYFVGYNAISGPGSITIAASGVAWLSRPNTFTGGTIIESKGSLYLEPGATLPGSISNEGDIYVDVLGSIRFDSGIAGSGNLWVTGTGGVALGSANSMSGHVYPLYGQIIVNHELALQNCTVGYGARDAGLDLNSIRAATLGGVEGSGTIQMPDGMLLSIGKAGIDQTFPGTLKGNGRLIKVGGGKLRLTGPSFYSGGTTIADGTIEIANPEALGQLGQITFAGGTLEFGTGNTPDYSARFSTAPGQAFRLRPNGQSISLISPITSLGGGLVVSGAGTVAVAGDCNLSGRSIVNGGTLQIGVGGDSGLIPGEIENNSRLVINRSGIADLIGSISGSGSIEITGTGEVRIAHTNTFQGGVLVRSGTLVVTNTDGSALGSGGLILLPGSRLAGTGAFTGPIDCRGARIELGPGSGSLRTGVAALEGATVVCGLVDSPVGVQSGSLLVNGSLTFSGERFGNVIAARSVNPNGIDGLLMGFDSSSEHAFTLIRTTEGLHGYQPRLDVHGIANRCGGLWYLRRTPLTLELVYQPVRDYPTWLGSLGLSDSEAKDDYDFDGDGRPNLLEYFVGSDPLQSDDSNPVLLTSVDNRITARFKHARQTPGVTGHLEVSSDLVHWSELSYSVETSDEAMESLVVDLPGGLATRFVRLRVTYP